MKKEWRAQIGSNEEGIEVLFPSVSEFLFLLQQGRIPS